MDHFSCTDVSYHVSDLAMRLAEETRQSDQGEETWRSDQGEETLRSNLVVKTRQSNQMDQRQKPVRCSEKRDIKFKFKKYTRTPLLSTRQ